jgi:uncharacterized membrane protein
MIRVTSRQSGAPLFGIAVAALIVATMALRLWASHGLPLWIDESWTAMIASQSSWGAFWREVWLDCNPPLYYALMALWTKIFGLSAFALRLPSLLFVTAAALLPLIWRVPGLSRAATMCLAALILLWGPGFDLAADARGYGLLLLLSTAQALAFIRLIHSPDVRRAALWAGLGSLSGLTHYHALLLAGMQGLAFLAVHRGQALRCWPAGLAFIPAFGWLAIHAPRLADYARPDVAWYEPMTPTLAGDFIQFALGLSGTAIAIALAILAATIALSRGRAATPADIQANRVLWLTAGLGVFALAMELGLGSARPMLADRYLVPLAPVLLLGLVLAVAQWTRSGPGLAALVILFALCVAPQALRARLEAKTAYGFARASAFIAPSHPAALLFSWDHPASRILDPGSLAKLGGVFLNRDGHSVKVRAIALRPGEDGNVVLQAKREAGIIWIYNRARASAARTRPPELEQWAGRDCQLEQGRWIGILACRPQGR